MELSPLENPKLERIKEEPIESADSNSQACQSRLSPPQTSDYSYLGPLSTTTLYGHAEDWPWSEDHYNHYTYLAPSTATSQEPLDYSMGSSMFPSSEESLEDSATGGPVNGQSQIRNAEVFRESGDNHNDGQVFETLGQLVKPDPFQYEEYDEPLPPQPKKRGRKKKECIEDSYEYIDTPEGTRRVKQEKITETFKQRKRVDRFDGLPEEEVMKRTLPDHLTPGLDIVIIGINPGLMAAFKGHHYAGPGNHFWKCLFLAGLIPEPMTAMDDYKLITYGIGFTNIVARATKGSADLSRKEIREGAEILLEKLKKFQPKIAVFNGKMIYEVFSGKKNFDFGRQPEAIQGTGINVFVMPSSSARCAQLPRAVDKVPFYIALKKLRDHLCGLLPDLDLAEVSFPDIKLKVEVKEDPLDNEDYSDYIVSHDSGNTGSKNIQPLDSDGEVVVTIPKPSKRGRKKKSELDRLSYEGRGTGTVGRPRGRGRRARGRKPVDRGGYALERSWSGTSTVASPYFQSDSSTPSSWQQWQDQQGNQVPYSASAGGFPEAGSISQSPPPNNYHMSPSGYPAEQSSRGSYYGGYDRSYQSFSQANCSYVSQAENDPYGMKVKQERFDPSYNGY